MREGRELESFFIVVFRSNPPQKMSGKLVVSNEFQGEGGTGFFVEIAMNFDEKLEARLCVFYMLEASI